MARIFITGSADGLGRMEAPMLVEQGHEVVLHGRNVRKWEGSERRSAWRKGRGRRCGW